MSKYLSIDLKDVLKGLGIAVAVALGKTMSAILSPMLDSGVLPNINDVTQALVSGIAAAKWAAAVYIGKNFLTNSENEFGKPDAIVLPALLGAAKAFVPKPVEAPAPPAQVAVVAGAPTPKPANQGPVPAPTAVAPPK
jgi:hypothetical protein